MDIDEIIQKVLDRTDVEFDVLLEAANFTLSENEEQFAEAVRYTKNPDYAIAGILQKRYPDSKFELNENEDKHSTIKIGESIVDLPTPDEVQYNESITEEHPLGEIVGSFECLVWLNKNGYHTDKIAMNTDVDSFGEGDDPGLFGAA